MGKISNLMSNNSRKISAQQFQSELKNKYTSEKNLIIALEEKKNLLQGILSL